MGGQLNIKGA